MRNAAETRKKLLDTAMRLIFNSNYAAVGVAEICKQAGVTKGSFYHHFETKADLYVEASRTYWEDLRTDFDSVLSPIHEPLDQLERLIDLILRPEPKFAEDDNPVPACPFFTPGCQIGAGEEKVRQVAIDMAERANKYDTALVRNLQAAGVLASDGDPEQLGRLIHYHIHGLMIYGRIHKDIEVVRKDIREGLYRLLDVKHEYRKTKVEA